jgi:hypothetical protein
MKSSTPKVSKWRKEHGPRDLSKLQPLDSYVHLNPVDLAYAAALIESEGHLWVGTFRGKTGKRALYPAVIIRMVEREPLDYMAIVFGGHITYRPSKLANNKGIFSYQACGRKAGAICTAILPYVKIVRKQAWAAFMVELADIVGRYSYHDVQRDPELKQRIERLELRVLEMRKTHANL